MPGPHLHNLLLIAAGVALLAVAFGVVPGADLPTVRPFLLAGWLLTVLGGLRLSAAVPPRHPPEARGDPRRTLIA